MPHVWTSSVWQLVKRWGVRFQEIEARQQVKAYELEEPKPINPNRSLGQMGVAMDGTLFMAAHWKAAGNETQFSVCAEGSHFYEQSPTPDGEKARIESESFLSSTLSN